MPIDVEKVNTAAMGVRLHSVETAYEQRRAKAPSSSGLSGQALVHLGVKVAQASTERGREGAEIWPRLQLIP